MVNWTLTEHIAPCSQDKRLPSGTTVIHGEIGRFSFGKQETLNRKNAVGKEIITCVTPGLVDTNEWSAR